MMKNLAKVIISLTFVFLALGCSAPTQQVFLDKKHAKRILACPFGKIDTPRSHAYRALLASLADVDWVIERMSEDHFQVRARACLGHGDYLKTSVGHCLIVNFIVMENAEILAYNPDDARVHGKMVPQANEWFTALERVYAELRCYSKEELSRRVPKQSP
jgi:hypothetical protein